MAPRVSGIAAACLVFLHLSQAFMIPSTISAPSLSLDSLRRPKTNQPSHEPRPPKDTITTLPVPDEILEKMKNLHLGVSKPWPFPLWKHGHEKFHEEDHSVHLDSKLDADAVKEKIKQLYHDLSSKLDPHFSVESEAPEDYQLATATQEDVAKPGEPEPTKLRIPPFQGGPKKILHVFHSGELVRVFTLRPPQQGGHEMSPHRPCMHRYAHSLMHKVRHVVHSLCSALRSFITGFLIPVLIGIAAGMTASLLGMFVGTMLGWLWVKLVGRKRRVAFADDDEDAVRESNTAGSGQGEKDTLLQISGVQSEDEAPPVYVEKE